MMLDPHVKEDAQRSEMLADEICKLITAHTDSLSVTRAANIAMHAALTAVVEAARATIISGGREPDRGQLLGGLRYMPVPATIDSVLQHPPRLVFFVEPWKAR